MRLMQRHERYERLQIRRAPAIDHYRGGENLGPPMGHAMADRRSFEPAVYSRSHAPRPQTPCHAPLPPQRPPSPFPFNIAPLRPWPRSEAPVMIPSIWPFAIGVEITIGGSKTENLTLDEPALRTTTRLAHAVP